jgi:hypothetical protein
LTGERAEFAAVLLVELGGLVTRSAANASAAKLAGMLVVELELGGWLPGRRRAPARPSSPACSWSSSVAGYQVGGDAGAAELAGMRAVELAGWPPGRRRTPGARI